MASPTSTLLSYSWTRVVPDCIVPVTNGRLSFVAAPLRTLPIPGATSSATPAIAGAVGATVSTTAPTGSDERLTLPARSVEVAVNV